MSAYTRINLEKINEDFDTFCFLNSNSSNQDCYLGLGKVFEIKLDEGDTLDRLYKKTNEKHAFWMGFIAYDVKNEIEDLQSNNYDGLEFSRTHLFTPEIVLKIKGKDIEILSSNNNDFSTEEIKNKYFNSDINKYKIEESVELKARVSKDEYINHINSLKDEIQEGNIYEINYCHEFYAEKSINPVEAYKSINAKTKAPFSVFYKMDGMYIMCASPERFLKKEGNNIISQPIKGTIRRGGDKQEDNKLKQDLLNNPKERSENVMIVDLVRNDLSKIANRGSVNVDELYGIYTFKTVHQMISTISAEVSEKTKWTDILKATFPAGSMTGAPKVSAMQLAEKHEETKRGVYAGTIGYIDNKGNMDWNVVIRTLLYNANKPYLSLMVGGAITINSDAESEYEETLLKARAIRDALKCNEQDLI